MKYYTIPETAEILHCSVSTIRRRIRTGELKSKKNGKLILISQDAINELINTTKIEKNNESYTPIQRIEKLIDFFNNDTLNQESSIAEYKEALDFLDDNNLWDIASKLQPTEDGKDLRTILQAFRITLKQIENSHEALLASNEIALQLLQMAVEFLKDE